MTMHAALKQIDGVKQINRYAAYVALRTLQTKTNRAGS